MTNPTQPKPPTVPAPALDERKRQFVLKFFGILIGLIIVTGGWFAWMFNSEVAITVAVICALTFFLFGYDYAWNNVKRQHALEAVQGLDEVLMDFFRAQDPDSQMPTEVYLSRHKAYFETHGDPLQILDYVRRHQELPGLHVLPSATSKEVLDRLREYAAMVAR